MNRYRHMDKPLRRRGRSVDWKAWGFLAIVCLALIVMVVVAIAYAGTRTTMTCEVDAKDRSVNVSSDGEGNVSSKTSHRVYTTNCGTFEVTDNLFFGKFNSSDTYGSLQEGQTYELDVVGWRNGFFSLFPNILGATAL